MESHLLCILFTAKLMNRKTNEHTGIMSRRMQYLKSGWRNHRWIAQLVRQPCRQFVTVDSCDKLVQNVTFIDH